jgi:site-specific recombinase XerD
MLQSTSGVVGPNVSITTDILSQGLRDHVLMATLLGTGLRISELLALDGEQYTGRGFVQVPRKGRHIRKS